MRAEDKEVGGEEGGGDRAKGWVCRHLSLYAWSADMQLGESPLCGRLILWRPRSIQVLYKQSGSRSTPVVALIDTSMIASDVSDCQ